ncbi:biopolymer transporter Tol [Gryllotalpicola reticulitermitis]|uniref:Biopolymer transporter Tol n=1 Tax=Gryllotalpicola reticulitermitis TaxID=1184153 RepID=A0ABV8Q4R5_9MICO
MARSFQHAGQRARLHVIDVKSGESRVVFESSEVLFEAPNWTADGWLVVNGDGRLFRIPAAGGAELEEIPLGDIPELNNDHVLAPNDTSVFVSAQDGHIYEAALDGSEQRRVTEVERPLYKHYLHGVTPDGQTLVFTGITRVAQENGEMIITLIPAAGGEEVQLTPDDHADDGPEFTRDGARILFNSERGSSEAGHAQLFSMNTDGSDIRQLTTDERVNWFPHQSPDGSEIAYVSFPSGTLGHPADVDDVQIRVLAADGSIRELARLFGGQGTMNVPSWSPDGTEIAYVDYPLS